MNGFNEFFISVITVYLSFRRSYISFEIHQVVTVANFFTQLSTCVTINSANIYQVILQIGK